MEKVEGVNKMHLFGWDDVDSSKRKLLKYLEEDMKIEWVKNATIEKQTNDIIITSKDRANSLTFKLNKKEKKVIMKVDGEEYEYIFKKDEGKLEVYSDYRDIKKKVHIVAMKKPFDIELYDLVVNAAMRLVNADNGRLRFIDYTGDRLVPGAIRGALEKKQEMAVRELSDCIVGRAAREKKIQRVNDVQQDKDFITFKKKVAKIGVKHPEWKDYHDKVLRHIGSEMAAPVLAGDILLGVLSVHTRRRKAFQQNEEDILSNFASELVVVFLNRRAAMLEKLHEIEKEMISEVELEQVATHIAEGIQKMVEASIPNIFRFDENTNSFDFLASAGASEEEIKLGSFPPRPDGRGMEAINKLKNQEYLFSWDNVPGKDNRQLIKHLSDDLKINWVKNAKIKKINDNEAITVVRGGNSLIFKLNQKECKATLEISAGGTHEYILKKENDELNLYNHEDAFVVVEDVTTDSRGSPTAKEKKINTTGCLPLVFRDECLGVLYLHFKDKKHFFTMEEKKTLKMFSMTAAIAIKNVLTSGSTHEDLMGDDLIEQLTNFKPKNLDKASDLEKGVYKEIERISGKLKNSRGEEKIAQCILEGVSKLCKILELPERFSNVFEKFQKNEDILYTLPYYRDHFTHMFHVFYLGYLIINGWWNINFFPNGNEKDKILKTWFITSISHDIAYPIEKAESWFPIFPKKVLDLNNIEIKGTFDWSQVITKGKNFSYIEEIVKKFITPWKSIVTSEKELSEKELAFKEWILKQILDNHDHSALSSLCLLDFGVDEERGWDAKYFECAYDAALNVVLHNYCKTKDQEDLHIASIGLLPFSSYPLAFLLTYCDTVQEWGRAKSDPLSEQQKLLDSSTRFFDLEIDDDKGTSVTLSYDIEKRCQERVGVERWKKLGPNAQKDEMHKEITKLVTAIQSHTGEISQAWINIGSTKHNFVITAVENKDRQRIRIPII